MDIYKFYKRINKKMINNFINDNQEEYLTLEFKTVSKADFSNRSDRKNFAKSLSGFANSSGGVIIWGVEAKSNKQGIDCACGVKEIAPLSQFMSRIKQLTGELINPPVEGVLHRKIKTFGDKGYAVTIVPESDNGPHMAMGFEGRHYKRSGDSFYPMEHFDIEDMFGRRKKPKLSLCTEITPGYALGGPQPTRRECKLFIGIQNSGRGIAKNVALAIEVNEPYHFGNLKEHTRGRYDFPRLRRLGSNKEIFTLGSDIVIHPKASLIVTIITFLVSMATHWINDVIIEAEIMAEEMLTVEEKIVISGKEIKSKVISNNT